MSGSGSVNFGGNTTTYSPVTESNSGSITANYMITYQRVQLPPVDPIAAQALTATLPLGYTLIPLLRCHLARACCCVTTTSSLVATMT